MQNQEMQITDWLRWFRAINIANIKQSTVINNEKIITPLLLTNLNQSRLVKSFNLGVSPFPTTVPGDTLLAIPPVNKTAMEGETVAFDCVAKGDGTIVNWFREGLPISEIQVWSF